jgi:hypothetical protein
MTDRPAAKSGVGSGVILFSLSVILLSVLIGGYAIHRRNVAGSLTASTSPQVAPPPISEPSVPSIPVTTEVARTRFLGTARYSDGVGDHVELAMTTFPLVRSGAVPAAALSACSEDTFGDPNSTLYREVTVQVQVTSSLAASVSFDIKRMNTPIGSTTNPIRSHDVTVVLMLSSGASCQSPYNYMGSGVQWKTILPGQYGTLNMWLSYPNVVSPDFPGGNATDLRNQSWLLPAVLRVNGNVTGPPLISGPGLTACAGSHRFFFTPSAVHLPSSSC